MAVVRRKTSATSGAWLKAGALGNPRQARLERHQLTKPLKERRTDHLHPSVIIKPDWCHRDAYYTLLRGDNLEQRNRLRTQNVFDEGHAIHDKWQRRFWDDGSLVGQFFCPACKETFWGTSPRKCVNCWVDWHHLTYNEVTLEAPELTIKGHTDGWLTDPCLIEIKSIGAGTLRFEQPELLEEHGTDLEGAWRDIKRPFPSHVRQGMLYLHMAKRTAAALEIPVPESIDFIYELKANQDFKFFTVNYDVKVIQDVLDGAQLVTDAIKSGVAPKCNRYRCGCKKKWED